MLVNGGSSNVSLLVGLSPGLRKYLGPAPWASWTAYSLLYCFFSRYWSDFGIQERSKHASVVLPVADVDKSFSHPPLDRAARTEHCLWCFLWLALKFSAISSELFIAAFQRQIREIHLLTFFFLHKSWSHHISHSFPVPSEQFIVLNYSASVVAGFVWPDFSDSNYIIAF